MLGVGINLTRRVAGARWWPEGASYALELVNRRAAIGGVPVPFAAAAGFSRASGKWAQTRDDAWRLFAPDEPAITDKGILLEPAFTELGNFADCAGAVPGVLGAGGALPTGWSETATSAGLTVTVLGSGIAGNGLPYVDIRFAGTASENWRIRPSPLRHLTVKEATHYIASAWISLIGGTVSDPSQVRMGPVWYSAAGAYISAGFMDLGLLIGPAAARMTGGFTAPAAASTANLEFFSVTAGREVDFSLRLSVPNLGEGIAASSPVLSTGLPVTRASDALVLLLPHGDHQVTLKTADGHRETSTASGGYSLLVDAPRTVVSVSAMAL